MKKGGALARSPPPETGLPRRYLKLPEYFLPSTLGPVALDLISARLPSFTSVGLTYDFTK